LSLISIPSMPNGASKLITKSLRLMEPVAEMPARVVSELSMATPW
jgi:hypothetical protein